MAPMGAIFRQHGCQSTTALVSDNNFIAAPFPDGHFAAASLPISPIVVISAIIPIGAIIAIAVITTITVAAAVRSDTYIKLSERDCRFGSDRSGHLSGECRKSPQSARSSDDYRQFSHLDLLQSALLLPTLPPSTNKSPICSLHREQSFFVPATRNRVSRSHMLHRGELPLHSFAKSISLLISSVRCTGGSGYLRPVAQLKSTARSWRPTRPSARLCLYAA
jgi:hypothetical protein